MPQTNMHAVDKDDVLIFAPMGIYDDGTERQLSPEQAPTYLGGLPAFLVQGQADGTCKVTCATVNEAAFAATKDGVTQHTHIRVGPARLAELKPSPPELIGFVMRLVKINGQPVT